MSGAWHFKLGIKVLPAERTTISHEAKFLAARATEEPVLTSYRVH